MTMNMQYWLSYSDGSGTLARDGLRIINQEIGFGYFKVKDAKHTVEGDTLYLNFMVKKDE